MTTENELSHEDREESSERTIEIAKLTIEIADWAAPYVLASHVIDSIENLYLDEAESEELAGVIRYCELRGLIQHHPRRTELIQILEP